MSSNLIYPERVIRHDLIEYQIGQDSLMDEYRKVGQKAFNEIANGIPYHDKLVEFNDSLFLLALSNAAPTYCFSSNLLNIMSKTKYNITPEYLMNKVEANRTIIYSLQINDIYSFNVLSHSMIAGFFHHNNDNQHFLIGRGSDKGGDLVFEKTNGQISIILKCLSYILLSGKPDFRHENYKKFNSIKKINRLNRIDKPIHPRISVGLGFEKDPLYRIGEWERRGHFRLQPYGPKNNPTHHELIWINNTIVHRKSGLDNLEE